LREWLEHGGHPRVDVSTRCDQEVASVTLTQQPIGAAKPLRWPIPVRLRWPGGARTILLAGQTATVQLPGCPTWLDANADRAGFYRVSYSAPLAAALAASAATDLAPAERAELISDAWADVRTGSTSPLQFLSLVTALRGERSPVVMAEIARRLSFIDEELLPAGARDAFGRFVAAEVAPQYRALGFSSRPADNEKTRLLRATIIDLLGRVAHLPEIDAAADRAALAYFADQRSLDPALAPVVLRIAARHDDGLCFRQLVNRLKGTQSPDEQRLYLTALTGFERPSVLKRTLGLLLTSVVPAQDLASVVTALMAQGREESLTAWDFMRQHFDAITERMPRLGWLLAPAAQLCDERSARQVTRFFGELSHRPTQPRRLQQTEEAITGCVALRRRTAAPLTAWLRARQGHKP
jgi:aminopeptidase N